MHTPRYSHGLHIFNIHGTDAAQCQRCAKWVRMNGPGSDNGLFAKLLHNTMDEILPTVQYRFWKAADRHDMDCHFGPNSSQLDIANKQFRANCYQAISDFYAPLQKSLTDSLRRVGGRATFFEALFSDSKRQRWAMGKELDRLIADRKKEEHYAELYYTALDIGSRSLVPSIPCTDERRKDEDALKV